MAKTKRSGFERRRPRGLTSVTLLMAALAGLAPLYYRPELEPFELGLLIGTPLLAWPTLFFFWRGHNWARRLVFLGCLYSILLGGFWMVEHLWPAPYANQPTQLEPRQWIQVGEGVFALFLLIWLMLPSVRRYFVLEAALSAPLQVPLGAWREKLEDRETGSSA